MIASYYLFRCEREVEPYFFETGEEDSVNVSVFCDRLVESLRAGESVLKRDGGFFCSAVL